VGSTLTAVGTLDKAVSVLEALEQRPLSLAELVRVSGLPRATAHRLAAALCAHGLAGRDGEGRYVLGPRLVSLGRAAMGDESLAAAAAPALARLRDRTGESVQLYVRHGDSRVCVAALDSPNELRTIVAVGAVLPLERGSAGRLLRGDPPDGAGLAVSVAERAPGVASVSAPVRSTDGTLLAAISVSGPLERLGREPGARLGRAVVEAASEVEAALSPTRRP
jgi:DNA-binding IclR family transcriptional regulator